MEIEPLMGSPPSTQCRIFGISHSSRTSRSNEPLTSLLDFEEAEGGVVTVTIGTFFDDVHPARKIGSKKRDPIERTDCCICGCAQSPVYYHDDHA